MSTILVNIILQDIIFEIPTGALRAAIIYQLLVLIILWLNRERLIKAIKILLESNNDKQGELKFVVKLVIASILFVGLRILKYFITIKW